MAVKILSDAQLEALRVAVRECNEVMDICQKAGGCGMDMRAQAIACEALKARAEATLREFGPNKRSDA